MFTFKLQSVANYRKAVEEKKQLDLAEGQRQLAREEARLELLRDEKAMLCEQLKGVQGKTTTCADIAMYLSYLELHKEKEHEQCKMVDRVTEDVSRQREVLLEAVQKRKVMDNLSEKQFQEYTKEINKLDRRDADETAVMRFIMQNK